MFPRKLVFQERDADETELDISNQYWLSSNNIAPECLRDIVAINYSCNPYPNVETLLDSNYSIVITMASYIP